MAKKERPLTVEIPRPADEQPAWSRVGVIAAAGFALGLAWPMLAGVQVGPSVPGDARPQPDPAAAAAAPNAAGTEDPAAAAPPEANPKNEQLVVVGPGKVSRCSSKKDKKIENCGELALDAMVLPKLKELAKCPSALGLEGKLQIGLELNFEKKELQVVKGKQKTSIPSSTINGILQCAGRELAGVAIEGVPHEHRKYTVVYTATFYPPGKHPEEAQDDAAGGGDEEQASAKERAASGAATVSWDTALMRKEPKDGDVVARLVRGTKVKLVGRQNDWYKIEHREQTGWVYRGAIGM